MCGIIGALSKHGTFSSYMQNLFTNMLRMDSIRGADSTGVFGVSAHGKVDFVKGNTDGYIFSRSKEYKKFYDRITDYKIIIGHNRKATSGTITANNAHPFHEKHIILVHNGTIANGKELATTEVDSHAIAHALADHDAVTALGKLDGAYALVWYEQSDKTLNLARNKERPLSLLNYLGAWVISSEVGLPLWLQSREDRRVDTTDKDKGIIQIPTDKILCFKLENLDKGYFEIPYEEYKRWSYPVVTPYKSSFTPRVNMDSANIPILGESKSHNIIRLPEKTAS